MSIDARYNRTCTIKAFTEQESDSGGVERTEAALITSYRCFLFPPKPTTRQLIVERERLESDVQILYGSGEYDATLARDQMLVDDGSGERYRILGVDPQYRNQSDPSHVALVLVKDKRGAAEA